jgi:Fe-S cluster assembly iron-binding protein IscA
MLTITEAAGSFISDLLSEANAPDDVAVRFVAEKQGLVLRLDQKQDADSGFDHEGRTIVVLDEEMSGFLTDRTLDVEDAGDGPKLSLR